MEQRNLAGWLRDRCQQEHLSLRQAGQRIGLSHTTIQAVMGGNRPSPRTVAKLASFFGGNGVNQRALLEDKLLYLAGWRGKPELEISPPAAELMDIIRDFSESQLKVLSSFANYLAEVAQRHGK